MNDFTMRQLEQDITEMKAFALADSGKKVEMAMAMKKKQEGFIVRLTGMKSRIQKRIDACKDRKKKKKLEFLDYRFERKIQRSNKKIKELEVLIKKYMSNYKAQREALGIYDHSLIDEFYKGKY